MIVMNWFTKKDKMQQAHIINCIANWGISKSHG